MHALGQFMVDQCDIRGWSQTDLARAAGRTKQSLGGLMNDQRVRLGVMIEWETVEGLAKAFEVDQSVILVLCAQSLGVPLARLTEPSPADPSTIPDAVLLGEVLGRFRRASEILRTSEERPRRAAD